MMTMTMTKKEKRMTAMKSTPHATKRSTKKLAAPLDALLITAPEPAAPAVGVDECPRCELCGEPAGVGGALCPACAERRDVPVAPDDGAQDAPAVAVEATVTPVMTSGQGNSQAARFGTSVAFYLRRQRRQAGAMTLRDEEGLIALARSAWRAALIELGGQETSA
jgi:hypothetical protein